MAKNFTGKLGPSLRISINLAGRTLELSPHSQSEMCVDGYVGKLRDRKLGHREMGKFKEALDVTVKRKFN